MENYIALFVNGDYIYGKLDEIGNFSGCIEFDNRLPCIPSEILDDVLSFNIPNLGYSIEGDTVRIFDKTQEEYTTYTLPVFVKMFGKLTATKKTVPFSIPTGETIYAAEKIYQQIRKENLKMHCKEEIEKLYSVIKEGNGIAYVYHYDFPYLCQILFHFDDIIKLFEYQYDHYIVGTKATKEILTLHVPEEIIPMVIGKGGKRINEMAKTIGAFRIKVKPIKNN